MILDPVTYWKFRAKLWEHAANEQRIKQALAANNAARAAVYEEAGLDPDKDYELNDASCEVINIPKPPAKQGK